MNPLIFVIPIAILALSGAKKGGGSGGAVANTPKVGPYADGAPPSPIAVGNPNNPEIRSILNQMDDYFRDSGINTDWFDAQQVTFMHQTTSVAIPPVEYWVRMANTLRWVAMPLREWLGVPIYVASAYRPPDYNEAVGGEPGSRHMWFEALDLVPSADNVNFALDAAWLWKTYGSNLRMGLGIYGSDSWPSRIHVDVGSPPPDGKRSWKNTKYWVGKLS